MRIRNFGFPANGRRASSLLLCFQLIEPLRRNRRRTPPQDGRILRRCKRRWIVEQTFAWLGNFRHLVVRYDRSLTIYRTFFHIA